MNLIDTTFVQLVWQQFWQCSLLVLAVYLICKSIRFRRSHLTFLLWLIVLLKFMTPPIWSSSSGLFCWVQESFTSAAPENPTHQEPRSLTLTESTRLLIGDDVKNLPDVEPNPSRMKITIHDGPAFENRNRAAETATLLPETVTALPETAVSESERSAPPFPFLELGLIVWALVAVLIIGVMGLRYWRCWRIMRRAGEQYQPKLDQLLARLCGELRVKRSVRLLITNSRMGPAVVGLFRPTIILPEVITQSRSLEELEPILAHELIHIRRGDLWIGLLQLLASVVWWFHPLVWFTGRRLKFEIEQCCDEEVLAELNCDPRVYAKCLLEVLELKQTLNTVPVVPGVRPVEITSKRLERIMKLGQGCQKRTPWWCWMIFVMLAAVVLPGAAFVVTAANPPAKVLQQGNTQNPADPRAIQISPVQLTVQSNRAKTKHRPLFPVDDPVSASTRVGMQTSNHPRTSSFPIKGLLKDGVGDAQFQVEYDLLQKIRLTISEQRNKVVLKSAPDSQKKPTVSNLSASEGILIFNDHLIVVSDDPAVHQQVAQALETISGSIATQMVIAAKIISVPRKLLKSISTHQKHVRVNDSLRTRQKESGENRFKHNGIEFQESKTERIIPTDSEVITQSMICEVLDDQRVKVIEQLIQSSTETKYLSMPTITMLNGQSGQIELNFSHPSSAVNAGSNQSEQAGISLRLRPRFSETATTDQKGMLDYQITVSGDRRLRTPKALDLTTGQEKIVEFPLLTKSRYEDAAQIKWGQTLLLGLGNLPHVMSDSEALLVMLQVEKVKPLEESEVMQLQGIGVNSVNSDAGVTGQIQLDESHFKEKMVVCTYPVADLVVPVPRKFITPGGKPGPVPPVPQPRFEPLVDLIKQNVTPEEWGDKKKPGSSIQPYAKTFSLVVRHTQAGHDQVAELIEKLIEKLRAFQKTMLKIELRFIATDDLQKWYQHWDQSKSADAKRLSEQLQAADLNQGTAVSASQAELIKQLIQEQGLVDICQPAFGRCLFNRQSGEIKMTDQVQALTKSECRIQFSAEVQQNDQVMLSMAVNADDALDAISQLKRMTVPKGKSMLVDITDQLTEAESSFLLYQLVRQTQQSEAKKQKRYFLLVTPFIYKAPKFVAPFTTPPSR